MGEGPGSPLLGTRKLPRGGGLVEGPTRPANREGPRGYLREGPKRGTIRGMAGLLTKIVTAAFVAFNAHCFFAAFVVLTALMKWPAHPYPIIVGAGLFGAVKEFYIDKHFEEGQTFADNAEDFAGYTAGIILGVLTARFFLHAI